MRYLVVLEKATSNWSAYSPDVPGCIATGKSPDETLRRYRAALKMHLRGLAEDGLPPPKPKARAETVEIEVASA